MKIKSTTAAIFVMFAFVSFVLTGYGQNVSGLPVSTTSAFLQTLASNDPVIRKIWVKGMDKSQLYPLAQSARNSSKPSD